VGEGGWGEGGRSQTESRFGGRAGLGVVALFLLLAILYTAPLVTHLADGLPFAAVPPEGRETLWRVQGDYLQFYYYLWLVRDRLLAGASFLRDPYQFAVDGPRLNLPNTFLPFALPFVALSAAGPRVAYNALVLFSFPLAGLATALLARRYGIGRTAAVVGGVVFACLPYRVGALLGGHPAGLAFGLVPLALWGLEAALAGSVAGGAWCGAALLSLAIVEPHFFYFAALGLPVYLVARLGLPGATRDVWGARPAGRTLALAAAAAIGMAALAVLARRGWTPSWPDRLAVAAVIGAGALAAWPCVAGLWRARAGWRTALSGRAGAALACAAIGAVAGAGFMMLLRQMLLKRSVSGAGRTLYEVLLFSPLPGDLVTRVNPFAAKSVYLGAVALALALAGTAFLVRRPPAPRARVVWLFPPLLVLATALSLGPRLPGVPLFEAAFQLVPFWNFVRQPAKFMVVAGLAAAILAAFGVEAALRGPGGRRGARRIGIALALAVLVAAEYHPWRPTGVSILPAQGSAHEAIRALGPRALWIPVWPGDSAYSAVYLHATTLTRVPMLNGYSAWVDRAYVTDVYRALEAINLGAVGEAEYAALRRHRVSQVIFDRDAFPLKVSAFGPAFTLASLRQSPFLELAHAPRDGDALWVFRVRERPAPPVSGDAPRSPLGIYWEAESLLRRTGDLLDAGEASNGRLVAAVAGRHPAGFLGYGQYRLLPAGPFRAVFRVRGEGSGVELQVATDGARRIVASRPVRLGSRAGFQEIEVEFSLAAPTVVEYRVSWDGTGVAEFDAVAVTFADVPDPLATVEVEALGHELAERRDPDASGGVAGHAEPARSPEDAVWSGPLRRYPAGRYRLWVRLKVDRATAEPLAWCGAQAASRGPVVGGRELAGAEVPEAGRYVELAVPFDLARPTVLELPCLYRGRVGVWFDRLRIERVS
jgi:hypothetical protein